MNISDISSIWPDWTILEPPLGRGAYATVYRAVRKDIGGESYAAIKVISIPSDPSEIKSLRSEGMDLNSTKKYLKGIVDEFVSEIRLMESLKGIQNIVSVEDYKVVENSDELGWTIYIRMELLTPFTSYLCDRKLEESEVIKIAQDLCTALEICEKRNIIHRDIKPENIFVNDFGFFKLGDFGIARTAENMTGSMSQAGTYAYMAPEVTYSSEYTAQVDIYSLGVVLYRLLNNNRLPFLDAEAQVLSPTERQQAIRRRISGEPLPPPCNASREMADVILHACAFKPSDRFKSPTDMKQALQQIADGTYVFHDSPHQDNIQKVESENQVISEPITAKTELPVSNSKFNIQKYLPFNIDKRWLIGAAALIAGIVIIASIHSLRFNSAKNSFLSAVEIADYDSAVQILGDHKKLMHNEDALHSVSDRISAVCDDYRDNALEYETAKSSLNGIASLEMNDISSMLTEAFTYLDQLNESRIHHNTANELYKSGEYGEAIKQYRLISEIGPNYENVSQKLVDASDRYREIVVNDASHMVQENEYTDALAVIKEALVILPEDSVLTRQYTVTETAYHDYTRSGALKKAAQHIENQEFQEAINELQQALTIVQNDSRLLEKLDEYETLREQKQCDDVLTQAAALAKEKNYIQAIDVLKNAISEGHTDPELQKMVETYQTEYISSTMKKIEALKKDRKYEEAISAAKAGLKDFPDCQEFKDVLSLLEKLNPISLESIKPINGGFNWSNGRVVNGIKVPTEDTLGNNYENAQNYTVCSTFGTSIFSEYYTNNKYETLTMLATPFTLMGERAYAHIEIFVDDELVYQSPKIERKTEPIYIDVDISGAKYVKICVYPTTLSIASDIDDGYLMLVNMLLWPAEK